MYSDLLFQKPCHFVLSCLSLNQLPESTMQEVAFVGRSNVGKSSLINALTSINQLARTSNTPGRTQALNFFCWNNSIHVVDLPGYGYAQAPRKQVESWQKLMKLYLRGRPQLARVFVLIDIRHLIKEVDKEMFSLLDEAGVSYQLVLTKSDKISSALQEKALQNITFRAQKYRACHPTVLLSSSKNNQGLDQLRSEIAAFISFSA